MKRVFLLIILLSTPLLMASLEMDEQPSYKPYEAPVLAPPPDSVPVSGKEVVSPDTVKKDPVAPTRESLSQGKTLFTINCVMCHGETSAERGPVGKKLNPPPPGLDHDMVRGLSDTLIFNAVTFGFGRMPPFRDKLSPEERWNLVNFLRTRK